MVKALSRVLLCTPMWQTWSRVKCFTIRITVQLSTCSSKWTLSIFLDKETVFSGKIQMDGCFRLSSFPCKWCFYLIGLLQQTVIFVLFFWVAVSQLDGSNFTFPKMSSDKLCSRQMAPFACSLDVAGGNHTWGNIKLDGFCTDRWPHRSQNWCNSMEP